MLRCDNNKTFVSSIMRNDKLFVRICLALDVETVDNNDDDDNGFSDNHFA